MLNRLIRRVVLQPHDVFDSFRPHQVDRAGLELDQRRLRLDHTRHEAVEVRLARLPVALVLGERERLTLLPFIQHEGARANGLGARVRAFHRDRVDDVHPLEEVEHRRARRFRLEHDGVLVGCLDGGEPAAPRHVGTGSNLRIAHAEDVPLDVVTGQLAPGVELDTRAQVELDLLEVGRDVPALGQHGLRLAVFVVANEAVVRGPDGVLQRRRALVTVEVGHVGGGREAQHPAQLGLPGRPAWRMSRPTRWSPRQPAWAPLAPLAPRPRAERLARVVVVRVRLLAPLAPAVWRVHTPPAKPCPFPRRTTPAPRVE